MAPPAKPNRDASLLSPSNYDDDASSLHSERSDQDTDSEDDEVLMGARTSADIRAHDRNVLIEEEERDRLLEESRRGKGRRGSALAPLKSLFSKSFAELPGTMADQESPLQEKQEKRKSRKERRSRRKERLAEDAAHGEDRELMYEME